MVNRTYNSAQSECHEKAIAMVVRDCPARTVKQALACRILN